MFSIICTTRRKFDALKSLFLTSTPDAELIIIDSNYNEETKKHLQEVSHEFQQITYAPPRIAKRYKRDFLLGLNTALMYAEHDWIIKIDDSTKVKPDFFDIVKNSIEMLPKVHNINQFVLRPIKLEEWSKHRQWEKHPILKDISERYVPLTREGLQNIYFITLDQVVAPREAFDRINGYDERYDLGHGYDDNNLMLRLLACDYQVIMDQMLMTYQYTHSPKIDIIDTIKMHWQWDQLEILAGKSYVFNGYDMKEGRKEMLAIKKRFVL